MYVLKRDGRKVEFKKDKIINAITAAFIEVDGGVTSESHKKACDIANYIEALNSNMTVEEIQDLVEDKLMATKRKDVAKAYVIYRYNRNKVRERKSKMMQDIEEKLTASNVQNQNANVDEHSFGGRVGEASDAVMKKYALD